jgi:hypothetical protein
MPAAASIPPALTDVPSSFGAKSSGNVAYNNEYFFVKYNGWRRFPLVRTSNLPYNFPDPSHNGNIYTDNQYFYLTVNHEWKKLPIFVIKPLRPIMGDVPTINIQDTKLTTFPRGTDNYGRWGMIAFNAEYFCIWGQGKWHKVPVARMTMQNYERGITLPYPVPPQENITLIATVVYL